MAKERIEQSLPAHKPLKKYRLNKLVEQEDIDYIFGAGLGIEMNPLGCFVETHYGENITEQQIRTLGIRGYYVSPDPFSKGIEKKEIPNPKELKKLPRGNLEEALKDINLHRGQIQESLRELNFIGGYLDFVTLRIMQEGYQIADKRLEQESFVYLDAIASGGKNEK